MRVFFRRFWSASIVPGAYPGAITTSACGPATIRSTVAASIVPVQRDDPAERRALVTLERALVGHREVGVDAHAARVGVLDDRARGTVAEIVHDLPRGVGVVVVEVREREPTVLLHAVPPARGAVPAIARRGLVRVLAVAQRLVGAIEREHDVRRKLLAVLQPLHDRARRTRPCARTLRARTRVACPVGHFAVVRAQLLDQRAVLIRAGHDRDPLVVLRRGRAVIAGPPMSMVSMSGRSRNG